MPSLHKIRQLYCNVVQIIHRFQHVERDDLAALKLYDSLLVDECRP